jgi:transposase-like protein
MPDDVMSELVEEMNVMGTPVKAQIADGDRRIATRRIAEGRSTVEGEARRRRLGIRSIEQWMADAFAKGEIEITEKSNWRPKHRYPVHVRKSVAARVAKGESPMAISREFLGMTPGMIRNWAQGLDMNDHEAAPDPAPLPPGLVQPAPDPDPAPAPARHPLRDEAVMALRAGMLPSEIIKALDLSVTADCIRDWDAEDRANKRELVESNAIRGGISSRYTLEQQRSAAQRWAKGEASALALGKELGCPASVIYQWARALGIEKPRELVCANKGWSHPPELRAEAVARVLDKGEPKLHVATALGVSHGSVHNWVSQELGRRAAAASVAAVAATKAEEDQRSRERDAARQRELDRIAAEQARERDLALALAAQAPPAPIPPAPKKIVLRTIYACPHCSSAISLPPAEPGVLRVTRGDCPHCKGPVEL